MNLQIFENQNSKIEYFFKPKKRSSTLVFVHGLGANLEQFSDQFKFFSKSFQVLAINVSGHGHSSSTLEFSLFNCANDVIDLIKELRIEKFHFIGNSMGGNIGYEILKLNPAYVLSYTSFGTTGELKMPMLVAKIVATIYRILSVNFISILASCSGQTKQSKNTIKIMMQKMRKSVIIDIVPKIAQFNYCDVISSSHCPALIIKGEKDADINKSLNTTINSFNKRGNFTLLEFENTGHFANLDSPDRFNAALLEFVKSA